VAEGGLLGSTWDAVHNHERVSFVSKSFKKALSDLIGWSGGGERDSYSYFKTFFTAGLGYPTQRVKTDTTGQSGIPDIALIPKDTTEPPHAWVVGEVKPEKGRFTSPDEVHALWEQQLRKYVSADTVYALALDPSTVVVLYPDGKPKCGPICLDKMVPREILEQLDFLKFDNSVSSKALEQFIQGTAPSRYIDVQTTEGRDSLHEALRQSARELTDYALTQVEHSLRDYEDYIKEKDNLSAASPTQSLRHYEQWSELFDTYSKAIVLKEKVLPAFILQTGKRLPEDEAKAASLLKLVYSTEAANLVLARTMFVRFLEDYEFVTRKISNGGIRAFQNLFACIKEDYRFLLESSFRDAKAVYAKTFEQSVFDWVANDDPLLSQLLLRVFYRLNAYDFKQITGDILGNVYERFLDPKSRKELGEYYTPEFVVDYILEAIGFKEKPGTILDPACGSGTFLFRAAEIAIQSFLSKGISYPDAIGLAVQLVHGLDINVFAAFIAQLQMLWHLLPHITKAGLKKLPEFNIGSGVDSLDTGIQTTIAEHLLGTRETKARLIRKGEYDYVVGNPPYIRAEVSKAGAFWREVYAPVATGKADTAFFFLYRSLEKTEDGAPSWLKPGGRMGWITSMGIADSAAAESLRRTILRHRLLELVDLESLSAEVFTSGMASRGTVSPILLIVEKKPSTIPESVYDVTVRVSTREACLVNGRVDLKNAPTTTTRSSVFYDVAVNPMKRFLTKIRREDLPVLRKLLSNAFRLEDYAAPTDSKGNRAVQVGVQTGRGKGKIVKTHVDGSFLMARGSHIHTFALNEKSIDEYVILNEVENKSLWRHQAILHRPAYGISEIGFAPQAAQFDPSQIVAQKTIVVMIPDEPVQEFPWDAYLNSGIVRFVFGLTGRSALVEGNEHLWRATINPKTIASLPVSKALLESGPELSKVARELREEAKSILTAWTRIDREIDDSDKSALGTLDVDFAHLANPSVLVDAEMQLKTEGGKARLQAIKSGKLLECYLEGNHELLELVKYMIEESGGEFTPAPDAMVPVDYGRIGHAIVEAREKKAADEFLSKIDRIDSTVGTTLGLTEDQVQYVHSRLTEPPLTHMQPRWPWVEAAIRPTRIYDDERYA